MPVSGTLHPQTEDLYHPCNDKARLWNDRCNNMLTVTSSVSLRGSPAGSLKQHVPLRGSPAGSLKQHVSPARVACMIIEKKNTCQYEARLQDHGKNTCHYEARLQDHGSNTCHYEARLQDH